MLKLLDKIVFLVSILTITGLLGAYASSFINPNAFVFPSLLGLAYPYLLIANLILLLYWIVRLKKMAWAELIIILLGVPTFMTYYGTGKAQDKEVKADIALMSYNVRYFDIYNWSNQKNTRNKIFDYLNNYKGDIICLQEFSLKENKQQEQALIKRLKSYPYHYIRKDMAIFSRVPIVSRGYLPFREEYSSACLYCDLRVGKDTIRVYSVHLESYKLGKKERQFMKELSQGLKGSDIPQATRNLTTRLTTANKNRARQAGQIQHHVELSPFKVILCGDFNDTPLSYTYRKLKTGMKDCFIECGRGLGNTYIGEFPSFRIDYILYSPEFESVSYIRDTIQLSDHYPIRGKIKMKSEE